MSLSLEVYICRFPHTVRSSSSVAHPLDMTIVLVVYVVVFVFFVDV